MLKKTLLIAALVALSAGAHAQSKKDLIAKLLKLQQPGIEAMATQLAEEPAQELMMRASDALPSRVPQDKREQVAKEIEGDLKKYADETVPYVRQQAVKLAPSTVGQLLEQKFTEGELKQIVAIIENPVYQKFQMMGGEMQKVLTDKLVAETKSVVTPKVQALEQSIGRRLGVTPQPAASGTR